MIFVRTSIVHWNSLSFQTLIKKNNKLLIGTSRKTFLWPIVLHRKKTIKSVDRKMKNETKQNFEH